MTFSGPFASVTVPVKQLLVVGNDARAHVWLSELGMNDFEVTFAEADLDELELNEMPVVLIYSKKPGLQDLQICHHLKRNYPKTQLLFALTPQHSLDVERVLSAGADDVVHFPGEEELLTELVEAHAELWAIRERSDALTARIRGRHEGLRARHSGNDLEAIQDVAVFTLAKVAESRDRETGDHLVRMREYSQILATALKRDGPYQDQINDEFLSNLWRSSPLHDIGKVGISDAILLKPGKFTAEEFEVMKQHTIIGANILDEAVWNQQGGSFLAMAAMIARFHHEKFDGSGYPAGLVGCEIPLPARIVALADVFDALTSKRPYKRAFSVLEAKEIIVGDSGKHFDPVIVDVFLAEFEQFVRVHDEFQCEDTLVQGAHAFLQQYQDD